MADINTTNLQTEYEAVGGRKGKKGYVLEDEALPYTGGYC
jgi:hypothetical protein